MTKEELIKRLQDIGWKDFEVKKAGKLILIKHWNINTNLILLS